MSEVHSRPSVPRGRGTNRAGRGGQGSRADTRSGDRPVNGEVQQATPTTSLDEQGELGQLKKQYISQLDTLKELFPDWTDDDLVFALQETSGDLQSTIERISEGITTRLCIHAQQVQLLTLGAWRRKCFSICRCQEENKGKDSFEG